MENNLGSVIYYQRKKQQLTQEQLCQEICSRKTLSKIENNADMDSDRYMLSRLVERLGFNEFDSSRFERLEVKMYDFYNLILEDSIEEAKSLLDSVIGKINRKNIYESTFYDILELFKVAYIEKRKIQQSDIKPLLSARKCFSNPIVWMINNLVAEHYINENKKELCYIFENLELLVEHEPFSVMNQLQLYFNQRNLADSLLLIERSFFDSEFSTYINFRYELLQLKLLVYHNIQDGHFDDIYKQIADYEDIYGEKISKRKKVRMHYQFAVISFMLRDFIEAEREYLYVINNTEASLNSIVCYDYCVIQNGHLEDFIVPDIDKTQYLYRAVLVNEYLQLKYKLMIDKDGEINEKLKHYIQDKFLVDKYYGSPLLKVISYEIDYLLSVEKDAKFRRKAISKGYIARENRG